MILVSHDRHLLRTVADELRIVHDGTAAPFDGDLEDYAKWLETAQSKDTEPAAAGGAHPAGSSDDGDPRDSAELRKQRKREEAEQRNRLSPLRNRISQMDRELERLSKETTSVQAQLADPGIYSDGNKDKLREWLAKQTALTKETERVEAAWMAASEELETATRAAAATRDAETSR